MRSSLRRSRPPRERAREGRLAAAVATFTTLGRDTAYGERVERTPTFLAALASAAVPGLDPVSVEALPSVAEQDYDVAFVQDHEHRRWVIRCPRTPAASAGLEQSAALLALLSRRLTMPVPAVKGWVPLPEGGRGAVSAGWLNARKARVLLSLLLGAVPPADVPARLAAYLETATRQDPNPTASATPDLESRRDG